jgi:hypothetical protein
MSSSPPPPSSTSSSASIADPHVAKKYKEYMDSASEIVDKLKSYNKMGLAAALQEEMDYVLTLRHDSELESVLCGNDLEYYIEMVEEARRDMVIAEIFRMQKELKRHKSRRVEEMTWLFMRHGPINLSDEEAIVDHEWFLRSFQEELEFLDEQAKEEVDPIAIGFGGSRRRRRHRRDNQRSRGNALRTDIQQCTASCFFLE